MSGVAAAGTPFTGSGDPLGDEPAAPGAPDPVGGARRAAARTPRVGAVPSRGVGIAVLAVVSAVFLIPIAAMLEFTVGDGHGGFTLAHYAGLFDPAQAQTYDGLFTGLANSCWICLITIGIVLLVLLPGMLLVELRYPRVRRVVEFVCLLPVSIPTVVLVVGFVPVYQVVGGVLGSDAWTLAFAIGVIVLPYAYRPIQANLGGVQVVVLSEAARSLGAGWWATVRRVLLPNLRRGILSSCFLTIAVVLGEFTIATFLSQTTFQTALLLLGQTDPYVSTIASLASLLLAFLLLVIIGRIGSRSPKEKP